MRIAINATPLLSPLTGIGQYTRQLILALNALNVETPLFYAGGWSHEVRGQPLPGADKLRWLRGRLLSIYPGINSLARMIRQQRFDQGVRRFKPALYHDPNFLPFRFDGPTVISAHDISWVRYPETHPGYRVRIMNQRFPQALEQVDKVITISEFVRGELMEVFGLAPEKVVVTPLAADGSFYPRPREEVQALLKDQGLEYGQYFLTVGTLEPRKNLLLTLNAYARLPEALRRRHPLVIVGMMGWQEQQFKERLNAMRLSGQVILTGYVSHSQLVQIYGGAKLFVYPSLYEGFGLPPLEAMASGVPVVISDRASLPEVGGDAALVVSADDPSALAEAMTALVEDPALSQTCIDRGLARAAQFSWQACAEKTIGVYHSLLAS